MFFGVCKVSFYRYAQIFCLYCTYIRAFHGHDGFTKVNDIKVNQLTYVFKIVLMRLILELVLLILNEYCKLQIRIRSHLLEGHGAETDYGVFTWCRPYNLFSFLV